MESQEVAKALKEGKPVRTRVQTKDGLRTFFGKIVALGVNTCCMITFKEQFIFHGLSIAKVFPCED